MLNGSNFKMWKDNLLIYLGVNDHDLALSVGQPEALTDENTPEQKAEMARWEKSNRISLMIMKTSIPEAFRDISSEKLATAEEYLEDIEKRFTKNEKTEIFTLLTTLISIKYNGKNIREYIMEMCQITSKLNAHKLNISDDLLVYLIMISLPTQFGQFRVSYNHLKENWTMNELISHCVQEKERLKHNQIESAHLASTSKNKGKWKKNKSKAAAGPATKMKQEKTPVKPGDIGCFFCGAEGHKKKNCNNYHAWRAKKGLSALPKTK